MYTDGLAFRGTSKAGYGVLIDGSSGEFSGPCGEHASNYVAEVVAIETALDYIKTFFDTFPHRKHSIAIFTDSMSALQGLENDPTVKEEFRSILQTSHQIIVTYGVEIIMQWIPGHSNIPGNDKADTLAKKGSDKNNHPPKQHLKQQNRSSDQTTRKNG